MAMSHCVNCEGTLFEISENKPVKATRKHHFVQCSKCGGVLAVLSDYSEIVAILQQQNQILQRQNQVIRAIAQHHNLPTYEL